MDAWQAFAASSAFLQLQSLLQVREEGGLDHRHRW